MQSGAQPAGHVPLAFGVVHWGPPLTGPAGSQQICPTAQHALPQQSPEPHVAVQGRGTHEPASQYSLAAHVWPHEPQFRGSL